MTRQVRRVAIVLFLLFGLLFVQLNYLQVLRADSLAQDPRNQRQLIAEYDIRRGEIIAGDGVTVLATSEPTDGRLRFLRRYGDGELFAHVTGYYSFIYGRDQLERTFNDFLVGSSAEAFGRNLGDFLAGRERVGDTIITTIRPEVQAAARAALGDRVGAVAAIDPTTGDVLALWSWPTYDPNVLSSHDGASIRETWAALEADPRNPRLNRAVRELYPPGSTFKIVTTAAALEAGRTPETLFEDPRRLELPQTTATIGNFGGGLCNGGAPLTLRRALEVSCNTTFAQLGLELGSETFIRQAEAFGLNRDWDFHLPLEGSRLPKELDPPQTAQSAIGQRDVRTTPLQMAMIAGAVANGGVLMTPRVVRQVEDFSGRVLRQHPPEPLALTNAEGRAVSPATAAALSDMMVGVVERGTGARAAIPGVRVAGKTGTAQTGEDRPPTVWFTGFAPADAPRVAVAVVLADGGGVGSEATGGQLAAPIARAVMEAALAAQ